MDHFKTYILLFADDTNKDRVRIKRLLTRFELVVFDGGGSGNGKVGMHFDVLLG